MSRRSRSSASNHRAPPASARPPRSKNRIAAYWYGTIPAGDYRSSGAACQTHNDKETQSRRFRLTSCLFAGLHGLSDDALGPKERAILLGVAGPLLGHRVVGEDRLDRALRLARPAVDALVGVDVILVVALVDTVDRANGDAGGILGADTRLGDNIGHGSLL